MLGQCNPCCLIHQMVRVEGRSIPYKGIISELTLCFYYNHACVVHVNEEHMKNEADLIAAAGGDTDPNSMSMSIASD